MITLISMFVMLAQVSAIDGIVRDARTHRAIPQANVEMFQSQTPVATQWTNADGRFGFGPLQPGHYEIVVVVSGYQTAMMDFDLPATVSPMTIEMNQKTVPQFSAHLAIPLKQLMPNRAAKEFNRAQQEIRKDNCAEAIGHLERGLRAFDKDASAHNDLGNCYRKLNRLDRAEASFKRARELTDSVYVALNLAEVYTAEHRFEEAKAVLNEAIGKNPDSGDAFYGLALLCFSEGRIDAGEAAALQAETRPHQIADLHLVLGKLYFNKGNYAASIRQLESYLKEAPNGAASESIKGILDMCRGAEKTCAPR
jgi:tetratricopeptide (TPR) repeat protein